MFGIAFAFFKIQNALTKGGIRSDEEDEIAGLDLPEMGVLAYPTSGMSGSASGPPAGPADRTTGRRLIRAAALHPR